MREQDHHRVTRKLMSLLDKRKLSLKENGKDDKKDSTCNAYRDAIKDREHPWRTMQWEFLQAIDEKQKKAKSRRSSKRKIKRDNARHSRKKRPVVPVTTTNVSWLPRDEWERQTQKFYASQEWKELRYEVLRNSGGACCCCGGRASDGLRIHVDHIKPRSKYPELQLDISNLQVLCEDCNFGKSNYYADDWRVKMQ